MVFTLISSKHHYLIQLNYFLLKILSIRYFTSNGSLVSSFFGNNTLLCEYNHKMIYNYDKSYFSKVDIP